MSRLRANLLLLITAFLWGTTFVAQQNSLESIGPFYFTGIRFLLGGLVVLPLGVWEYRKLQARGGFLTRRHWIGMALCGVCLFIGSICQQLGLKDTSVTNAGFLTGLYVPLVPLLMLVFWRRLPHWSIWPAAFGCMVGTYYLSGGNFSAFNVGDFWVLLGSIFWALQVIIIGFVVQSAQTPILTASIQFLWCGAFGIMGALMTETFVIDNVIKAGPEILYAGILSSGVAFTLQAVAQRYTPQADAAIIMSGEILFAALAGALMQGDRLSAMGYVGCLIMFVCIVSVEILPLVRRKVRL